MAITDELVTVIRFDMPASAKKALHNADRAIGGLTNRIKDLGLVTVATSGITAAWGINAANSANDLMKASQSTGLGTAHLQEMASVYKSVGGEARNAARDADVFRRMTGRRLNIDNIDELKKFIDGMNDIEAVGRLEGMGYSGDMLRVLRLSTEERRKRLEYARENHTVDEQELETLNEFNAVLSDLGSTISTLSRRIKAAVAPLTSDKLGQLTKLLQDNKEKIIEVVDSIVIGIQDALGKISGIATATFNSLPDLSGWWDALKPSENMTQSFESIKESIASIISNLSNPIKNGALQELIDTLAEIEKSPVIQALKDISWAAIETAFKGLEVVSRSVFESLGGILEVLKGIATLDLEQTIIGFQRIGYQLINAIKEAFTKIIPELLEKIYDRLSDAIPILPKGNNNNIDPFSNDDRVPAKPKLIPEDIFSRPKRFDPDEFRRQSAERQSGANPVTVEVSLGDVIVSSSDPYMASANIADSLGSELKPVIASLLTNHPTGFGGVYT